MAKKLTYVEIRNAQDQINHTGSLSAIAYTLGAYETLIASIVAYDLPIRKQQEFLRSLEALKARVEQIVE